MLFLRFMCPMDCSCMINFIEVPFVRWREKINTCQNIGGRQHRTTPAGQIGLLGGRDPCNPCGVHAYACPSLKLYRQKHRWTNIDRCSTDNDTMYVLQCYVAHQRRLLVCGHVSDNVQNTIRNTTNEYDDFCVARYTCVTHRTTRGLRPTMNFTIVCTMTLS